LIVQVASMRTSRIRAAAVVPSLSFILPALSRHTVKSRALCGHEAKRTSRFSGTSEKWI
jgi:hypothetical protein